MRTLLKLSLQVVVLTGFVTFFVSEGFGADWPMWRYDAHRSAASPQDLPEDLHLQWVRELPPPRPAWLAEQDYHGKLKFDVSYEPVVMGKTLFVPSMTLDNLTAYDTDTGAERWRFDADGPVRFAPVAWQDRVYFVSDDGYLYCVDAAEGSLLWKFRGGPSDRKILGNERLISTWPARGAPVVADGTVYFAAGIWPFMGIFLHALDAETGEVVWTNSGEGSHYNLHQHGGAHAFGGVAPQGYLAVSDDKLVVSGGLTVPAVYDRQTGEFLHYRQSSSDVGKGAGGYAVSVQDEWYFNHGQMYSLADGTQLKTQDAPVLTGEAIIGLDGNRLVAHASPLDEEEVEVTDRRGRTRTEKRYSFQEVWKVRVSPELEQVFLQAGSRLYGSGEDGLIAAVELPKEDGRVKASWTGRVEGRVWSMLAADEKLFVVTEEGKLFCFGGQETEPVTHAPPPQLPAAKPDRWTETAKDLLQQVEMNQGYALAWGIGSGRLVEELARQSELDIIAIDPDAEKVKAFRKRLEKAGLYGDRVAVHAGDPLSFQFPPYLAGLIVSEDLESAGFEAGRPFVEKLFHPLRPYGGVALLPVPQEQQEAFAQWVAEAELENAQVERDGGFASLTRVGALPGAGQWTHQYASPANTVFSKDSRVKTPLGVLWFGGPSNHNALPRHAQGPVPHVVGGRLIIEGVNTLSARCVYTGRELWLREFPDIGFPYKADNHTFTGTVYINNQPGANFIGSNYASTEDGVYVVYENECLRLDPATGETLSTFRLPGKNGDDEPANWGYIGIWNDLLIAGASPQIFDDGRIGEQNWNATSSERLVVMDRHSGEVLWTHDAHYGFRHNAIVTAAGKLFVIDRLSEGALALLERRGADRDDTPRLMAFDARGGELLWSTTEDVFGTWLGYSEDHDVLVQAGRTGGRRPLADEPSNRMIAHRGDDGSVLWDKAIDYVGPLVLHGEEIISSDRGDGSVNLLTGKERTRKHPLTGSEIPWTHTRTYGCGTMLASEHLFTFRSGAAGYYDYRRDGGTGNFGGFRAGCTPNLVPADGVLNAPDYTRTCACSYQNQTSLALVHMPEVDVWTYSSLDPPDEDETVRQVGINLAAPGDRLADDGMLWLDYPSVGGSSPDPSIRIEPEDPESFLMHSSQIEESEEGLRWVAASGLKGLTSLALTLAPGDKAKSYTVRLHFAEPDSVEPGERLFNVSLQGREVLNDFDIVREAGGRNRPVVREFTDVEVNDTLQIDLAPSGNPGRPPVLCGVEVRIQE